MRWRACSSSPAMPAAWRSRSAGLMRGDVDWHELREAAHRRQAKCFSAESMAAGVARVYDKLLARQKARVSREAAVEMFGMSIDALRMERSRRADLSLDRRSPNGSCRYVVTPNVDHAVIFQQHEGLRQGL